MKTVTESQYNEIAGRIASLKYDVYPVDINTVITMNCDMPDADVTDLVDDIMIYYSRYAGFGVHEWNVSNGIQHAIVSDGMLRISLRGMPNGADWCEAECNIVPILKQLHSKKVANDSVYNKIAELTSQIDSLNEQINTLRNSLT